MRISDWSSDVCSSDLRLAGAVAPGQQAPSRVHRPAGNLRPLVAQPAGEFRLAQLEAVEKLAPIERQGGLERGRRVGLERSEEHTSELQSLMRISYAVFCLKKKQHTQETTQKHHT